MEVAVVILNYNSSKDTIKCLKFLKQQQNVDLHIIVVDNCSQEQDRCIVEKECITLGVEFILSFENRGYSAGNNIGLRRASEIGAKYALVINPDMELVDIYYLEKLVEVMEKDEDVVVVGSDVITPENFHQNPMKIDGNWRDSFEWVKWFNSNNIDKYKYIDNYKESHVCFKLSGCCLLLRMNFIEKIGYFDEYPFLYCEEPILARQVDLAGKKMFYLADVQAIHRHIKSEKGDPVKRFKHWQRSRIYFSKRYSKDSWLGRQISILSMRLYVLAFTVYKKIMKHKFGGNRHFVGKKFGGNRQNV